MLPNTHADRKYVTGTRLSHIGEWDGLRLEYWRHEAGTLPDLTLECTEIGVMLAGELTLSRIGDGEYQETFARAGTAWICPSGTHEQNIQLSHSMPECMHIFMPPTLLEEAALEAYGICPSRARLSYAGGMHDPLLTQFALTFRDVLTREGRFADRLLVDGMKTSLAAHLVRAYSRDSRAMSAEPARALDRFRLVRVTDFIAANLGADLSLDELAMEACLSPFHFSRLFRQSTGLTPHRFVLERRIEAAKTKLTDGRDALVEIALDTGFGSQSNFNRVFLRMTGYSPGQFRKAFG